MPDAAEGVSESGADEPRIKYASQGNVSRALDDRPSIFEKRDGVFPSAELKQQTVYPHFPQRLETLRYLAQINRSMVLMNLDRIASAQGDVRTSNTAQVLEIPTGTN